MESPTPFNGAFVCPKPIAPESGSVTFSGVRPNDNVIYSCNDGYIATGRSEFKCLVSGEWETIPPYCEPVNCGHPGSPNNGYIVGRAFTYGSRVRFECNRGFELDGPASLYCDEYGEWDNEIPDCVEIQCEIPILSENTIASVSTRLVSPGTTVTFSCKPGNKLLSNHDSSYCQIDGTFDKSVPTCDPERCPTPPIIDNGEPQEIKSDYGVGETVQYQCLYGYRFSYDSGNRRGSVNCLPSGEWEDNLPVCEEILCPEPPFVQNAEAVGDDRWVDAEVTYQCNPGYESVGRNTIRCLDTQAWTRLRMKCRPVECGDPPQISFASFTGDSYRFESNVEYKCDQGYVLEGNGILTCGADKSWKGEYPACVPISCGLPLNIDNGDVSYGSFTFGNVADYTCRPGYIISGSARVICEANGSWRPNPPVCRPRECPVPPDVPNAVYSSPQDLVFNASVTYQCNVGHLMLGSPVLVCNANAEWTPQPPECQKVSCPKPIAPQSGSVKFEDLSYASIASYSCDEEFRLIGVDGRSCQADGTWSDVTPTCEATTCQPHDLVNGRVDYKDLSIGSIVTYSCEKGFELVGDGVRKCQANLTFDGVAPVCNQVDCGDLPSLQNGNPIYSTNNTAFGTTAKFVCNAGYIYDGVDNVYCGPDGKWSGSVSQCIAVTCPKVPKVIPNGRIIGSSFDFESVLTYQCDAGFALNGPGQRTCQADGTWDKPPSFCVLVTCPEPRLAYGFLSTQNTTTGTVVRYSCQSDYALEGPIERTCLSNGTWSGTDPLCLKIKCNTPAPVEHARSAVVNQTTIEYTCNKGFDLIGSRMRVCERDDIWQPDAPQCTPAFCKDLSSETLENGQVLFKSSKVGEIVQYACNPGYVLKGDEKQICLKSGLWRGDKPKCDIKNCGYPSVIPNGAWVGSDHTFDAVVRIECNDGYTLKGADSIRCGETGWEDPYPSCERVYCPDLRTRIPNGRVYVDSTAYLGIAQYVCKKGFKLQGVQQRKCLDTEEWSESEPSCIPIVCPDPDILDHGVLLGIKDSYRYGDKIEYQCDTGFYRHGSGTRRCTKDATWSGSIPNCFRVNCPEPSPLQNGDFIGDFAKYESVITFYCFEGYRLVGDKNITCEANGQWSRKEETKCERIICGQPPRIDNASPNQTVDVFFNSIVQYTCDEGYAPSGKDLSTCLANSTWSHIDFSCLIISCPSFSNLDIPHGSFDTPSFQFNTSVEFTCKEGYELIGENVITCQSSGAWSSGLPSCNIVECPTLGTVEYGSVKVESLDYGSIATVSCNLGYILNGSSQLNCLSSGIWNGSLPTCDIVICSVPPVVVNGKLLNSDGPYVFKHELEYACDFGYELQGFSILQCTEFGSYDNPPPICRRILCPEVEDFAFGQYTWVNETFVSYECLTGYNLVGSSLRECLLGGFWDSQAPECRPVPCSSPPSIDNGSVIGSKHYFGEFVEYRCNEGHNLIGSPISLCLESGTWSEKNALCTPVNCGEPDGNFDNGQINGDIYTYLQTVEYVCHPGFELEGRSNRTCQGDGEWSETTPACVRQKCGTPDPIANGFVFGDSYLFESIISYNCSIGYELIGEVTRTCESSLKWSGISPSCSRISCPTPADVVNGFIDGSSYLYEDTIKIFCNRGYRLEGSETRVCQADRSWSGVDSVCIKIYCPVPPPTLMNGFNDYEIGNVYGVDDVLTLLCDRGYIMNGTGQKVCESSGSWSTNILQCNAVVCPEVNDLQNGAYISDSPDNPFTYPSSLTFTCNQGFRLKGSLIVECRSSGIWSEAIPTCSIIQCEDLVVENGFIQLQAGNSLRASFTRQDGKLYVGDSVLIQCDAGYEMDGLSNTSCSVSGTWESGYGSCQRIHCPDPSLKNGIISGTSNQFTDEIQLSCNRGYRLEGSELSVCQADRSWSGVDAVCNKIYCPVPPPTLLNGFSDYEIGNVYGVDDILTFFCSRGYIMNGTGQRVCEPSGSWSKNILQCNAVTCPDVGAVENGAFESDFPESPFTYPSSLFFTCNEGFRLTGSSSIECKYSGAWSEVTPTCSVIECEKLSIKNGFAQLHSENTLKAVFLREDGKLYAGDNVLIQCDKGYEIQGISNTSCSQRGRWKSGYGSCQRVQCPVPRIENGVITGASYFNMDKIQISCNRGYRLEGPDTRVCQADRSWSGVDPVCIKIYCPVPPPTLQNGFDDYEIGNVYAVGDVLTVSCAQGYIMNGTGQRVCESSGEWSTNSLHCYAISCPAVTPFENGVFNSDFPQSPFTYPSSLYFVCDLGFQLDGESPISCEPSGEWSKAIPRCSIIECETLLIENGILESPPVGGLNAVFVREDGKFYAGDTVAIQCNPGYELSGEKNGICSMQGTWVTESFCNPVTCVAPYIKSARFSDVSETFDNKIQVSCEDGLDLIGQDELTCGADTNWIETLPRCELLACGSPPKVENAVLKGESFNLGDVVNYECKSGYDLVGNNLLTCGPSNQWLGSYPVCVRVNCGPPSNIPDSYIDYKSSDFKSIATIQCVEGYKLQGKGFIVCEADRQWKVDSSSMCVPIDCGNTPQIPNGSVFAEKTTFGSLAVYTCDAGHVIEGASTLYCDSDGQWGYEIPKCSPVSCLSDISPVAHASFTTTGSFYQDVATFECEKGYTFEDPSSRELRCGEMGNWKGQISECVVIDCGPPPQFKHAFSSFELTTYSSNVSFSCIPGFESKTSRDFTCSVDGTWKGEDIECVRKDCLKLPELLNGEYSQASGTLYESEVTYNCLRGYEKTGPDVVTCTTEGKWTSPYCAAVDCQNPNKIEHGQYQLDATTYESEAKYQCDAGYILTGEPTIECLDTGVWTPTKALCKPLNCREPPVIKNSNVEVNSTLYLGVANYSCEIGFFSKTPMSLSCDDTGNWIGAVPKCDIISCPPPKPFDNGFLNFSNTNYLSVVTYSCNVGHKLVGHDRRTCLENGTWSDEVPKCSALECSQPKIIENGNVTTSGLQFGSLAHFSCLDGYTLEGDHSLICDEKGLWNSSAPKCSIIDCKTPPVIAYGEIQYSQTTFQSKAAYTCIKGYSLTGTEESACQADGQWSDDGNRECKLITCPPPPPLENGSLINFDETFGSQAVYRCNTGYKPQTLSILTCDKFGSWRGQLSSCYEKLCPKQEPIENGKFEYQGDRSLNSVVTYSCDTGYYLFGYSKLVCTSEEKWSHPPPVCKPVTCPKLPEVPNSISVQDDDPSFMSVANFQCQDGYKMSNKNNTDSLEAVYICGEEGFWQGEAFSCDAITCSPNPPPVDNAIFELTLGNTFGSNVVYKCETGYIMNGLSEVYCDKNGKWNPVFLPECEIVYCPLPPSVIGSSFDGGSFTYGSIVSYSCYEHHKLVGDNTIQCQPDGQWTPVAFSCEAVTCKDLVPPQNGKILNAFDDIFVVGSLVDFACNDGFTLVGTGTVSCQGSGFWDFPAPWCQKVVGVCEESLAMGKALPPPPGRFPGDVILVECQDGYIGAGDMFARCQDDGSWKIPEGQCRRISCGRPDSYNRRNVRVFGRSFLYGDRVRYMCRYGFSPAHNPPLLECMSSGQWNHNAACIAQCKQKCENGGRCLGLNRCKCMSGWAGFKCHLPICIFPCLNGGQCEGPYKCKCRPGYQGSRCERAFCPRPCQNGGRCLRPGKCHCLPGFQGTACEDRLLIRGGKTDARQ